MNCNVIILAAGKGTRMKSKLDHKSKVSYEILGVPLVEHVLNAVSEINPSKIITIVGFGGEVTKEIVTKNPKVQIAWQLEQKGTGHAVMQAQDLLDPEGVSVVLCGDAPLIRGETLKAIVDTHVANGYDETVLTAVLSNPHGYGRIVRNEQGLVSEIVEQSECDEKQNLINEVNTGVVAFSNKALLEALPRLTNNNKKGEYYLTDLIAMFNKEGKKVGAVILSDPNEMLGINDRVQLAEAAKIMKQRINKFHMLNGVTLIDPENTYIGPYVQIGADTVIEPNVHIYGKTTIGERNFIGATSYITDSTFGDDNSIVSSQIEESTLGDGNAVGPFAHLRPKSSLANKCKVGNYSELKNAQVGNKSKVPHLTYLGDCTVGEGTNIGCGTIVANYDGVNKTHTDIGDNVFVGSGATIISPVNVASNSFIAAGSTINRDVNEDDMAISRPRQENKPNYAHVLKEKALAKKAKKNG